ncbi:MAG: hypothetical protein K1X63_06985 [Chitinophagales bacterium]|nr:hypothetical protein [Chitinophagales bacterium]
MPNGKERSPHILNTSSNLLGICFLVLTSLRVMKVNDITVIDEITAIAIVLFMLSSILSFLSLRSANKPGEVLESIADFIFLAGLALLFVTTILVTFNFIR